MRARRLLALALVLAFTHDADACAAARRPRHRPPWTSPDAAFVLDPYQENDIDLPALRRDPRVLGIIHKATEGSSCWDLAHDARREEARRLGFLWGSYHFGRPGDVAQQVDFYLRVAQPDATDVVALDVDGVGPEHMSLDAAAEFVERVHDRVGRYPVLYASPRVLAQPMTAKVRTTLSLCPAWLVRYLDVPEGLPEGMWPGGYTLWQFSSEIRRVVTIEGADRDTDVDVFHGSRAQLLAQWPFAHGPRRAIPARTRHRSASRPKR